MLLYGVVLFSGTQAAIRAEKLLAMQGHLVKLIPTPRHLSSDCGVALRFIWANKSDVLGLLQNASVDFEMISFLES